MTSEMAIEMSISTSVNAVRRRAAGADEIMSLSKYKRRCGRLGKEFPRKVERSVPLFPTNYPYSIPGAAGCQEKVA
jgi:hypothetical protein